MTNATLVLNSDGFLLLFGICTSSDQKFQKLTTSDFLCSVVPKQNVMTVTRVQMKNPTKTPEATISVSGFFSSFRFHVPPTPRNLPLLPTRQRIRMIRFKICKYIQCHKAQTCRSSWPAYTLNMEAEKFPERQQLFAIVHGVMPQTIRIFMYVGINCLPECDTLRPIES